MIDPRSLRRSKRRCRFETLEPRRCLSGDAGEGLGFGSLTISIAPDATPVGLRESQFVGKFDALFGTDAWQETLREAVQTWVPHADINIGFVPDDGTPAGTLGPWRGDERFGDIRIYGYDLPDTFWAEAISADAQSSGSWAGDIVFNTAADWTDLEQLKTATIHELGHILSLPHSADPLSPMHAHGPSGAAQPTAEDIALLQEMFGPRNPDPIDAEHPNDSLGEATLIRGGDDESDSATGFNGQQVWLNFADLTDPDDVDYFELRSAEQYSGPITIAVQTAGLSVAQLQLKLLDQDGNLLQQAIASDATTLTTFELDSAPTRAKYFLEVSSVNPAQRSVGSYAVYVATPTLLADQLPAIQRWAAEAHRWFQTGELGEHGYTFTPGDPPGGNIGDDDEHSNDDPQTAVELPIAIQSSTRVMYATVGSISDLVDIDAYQFRLPQTLPDNASLTINLQSLNDRGLVPAISITDKAGSPLATRVTAQGYGSTQLVIDHPVAGETLVILLEGAPVEQTFRVGNFSLMVDVRASAIAEEVFTDQILDNATRAIEQTLYVAHTQLFTFNLASETIPGSANDQSARLIFRLFSEPGELVTSFVTGPDQLRTMPGQLLEAGVYHYQITVVSDLDTVPALRARLTAKRPSNPVGPLIASLDDQPLYECPTAGSFCYPDGTQTTQTAVVSVDPPPPLPDPPSQPPPPSTNDWFWLNVLLPTNPLETLDVNGDSVVAPIDALIVINFINRNGTGLYPDQFVGYLDVNQDGRISPIDALRVVNALNRGA